MTNNDNTLVLFANEYKKEGSNQPDYKGKATVGGVEYQCAGWKQIGKQTNKVYLSVKLTVAEEAEMPIATVSTPKPKPAPKAFEDDIPF